MLTPQVDPMHEEKYDELLGFIREMLNDHPEAGLGDVAGMLRLLPVELMVRLFTVGVVRDLRDNSLDEELEKLLGAGGGGELPPGPQEKPRWNAWE